VSKQEGLLATASQRTKRLKIHPDLLWDEQNVQHLWQSHQVTPDEIEEALFGLPGEEPTYFVRRHSDYYVLYAETGSGRLLICVGEFIGKRFRVFAARDMAADERRAYRRRK
jgi:uncharacterized DUF497 family protein